MTAMELLEEIRQRLDRLGITLTTDEQRQAAVEIADYLEERARAETEERAA